MCGGMVERPSRFFVFELSRGELANECWHLRRVSSMWRLGDFRGFRGLVIGDVLMMEGL